MWPGVPAEATEEARRAAESGIDVVVAMGGDGMVHHVAQGLVDTGTALGIIPVGTTNVVARLLDIPDRHTRAARLIQRSTTRTPLGMAKMTVQRGTIETLHHAVFACGAGLDARVVVEADKDPYRKYRFGSIHYLRTALGVGLRTFPKVEPHVEVSSGDRHALASTVLVQFRSVYTFFGRLPIRFSESAPDPMTILTLERLRRHRVPQIAWDALTGRDLEAVGGIEVWEAVDSLDLVADPPVAIQADGESLGVADALRIEWAPRALSIVTPGGDADESSAEGTGSRFFLRRSVS